MPQSRLVKYIPELVVCERTPLAEEQNAYGPWLEAAKFCYDPPEEDDVFWSFVYPDHKAGENMWYPTNKTVEHISEILKKNQRAFDLVNEGIARGGFQIPESVNAEDVNQLHSCIVSILEMSLVKARKLLSEGCLDAVVQVCIDVSRIGSFIESSATSIRSIFALANVAYSRVATITELLIDDKKVSPVTMRALLDILRQPRERAGGFVEGLRCCICYNILPRLDRMPDDADTEGIVDAMLEEYYENELSDVDQENGGPDPSAQAELEQQLAWRREKILFLISGHPCPFDKRATARLIGEHIVSVESIFQKSLEFNEQELPEKWDSLFDQASAELESWPAHLFPSWIIDIMGNTPAAKAKRIEYSEWGGPEGFPLPPTEEDLIEARDKIASVSNPLGKLLLVNDCEKIHILCDFRLLVNAEVWKLESRLEDRLRR